MVTKKEWFEMRKDNKRITKELEALRLIVLNKTPEGAPPNFPIISIVKVQSRMINGRITGGRFSIEFSQLASWIGKNVIVTIESQEEPKEREKK